MFFCVSFYFSIFFLFFFSRLFFFFIYFLPCFARLRSFISFVARRATVWKRSFQRGSTTTGFEGGKARGVSLVARGKCAFSIMEGNFLHFQTDRHRNDLERADFLAHSRAVNQIRGTEDASQVISCWSWFPSRRAAGSFARMWWLRGIKSPLCVPRGEAAPSFCAWNTTF